ncbi:MAG: tetratricopeptide repeat protein [SAR202 cluster bacterium]|nr:tetratricopeptide repeat protein [SAR202 cluster bacterium]
MNKTGYKAVQSLASSGRWQELEAALSAMAGSDSTLDPGLMLLQAECALRLQRPHETVSIATSILSDGDVLPTPVRAKALLLRASASRLRGYIKVALEDAEAGLALLKGPAEAPEMRIEGSRQLGLIYGATGDLDQAIQYLEEALGLCARSGDLNLSAAVHHNLGTAFAHLGRLSEAQVHFNHARSCYEKIGNRLELSEVLNNLAQSYADMGLFEQALTYFHQGLNLAKEHNYRRVEAIALMGIGDALKEKGRFDEALEHYRSSFDPARDALEPRLLCYANMGIGNVYMSVGRRDQARTHFLQANYEARRLGLKYELGLITLAQGFLDAADKNLDKAKVKIQESIDTLEGAGAVREVVKARLGQADVLYRLRGWPELDQSLLDLATLVRRLDLQELLCLEGRRMIEVMKYGAKRQIGENLFVEVYARLKVAQEKDIEVSDPAIISPRLTPTYPRLEVISFGDAQVLVDGEKITQAQWESQKAKELFFSFCAIEKAGGEKSCWKSYGRSSRPASAGMLFTTTFIEPEKPSTKNALSRKAEHIKSTPKAFSGSTWRSSGI